MLSQLRGLRLAQLGELEPLRPGVLPQRDDRVGAGLAGAHRGKHEHVGRVGQVQDQGGGDGVE